MFVLLVGYFILHINVQAEGKDNDSAGEEYPAESGQGFSLSISRTTTKHTVEKSIPQTRSRGGDLFWRNESSYDKSDKACGAKIDKNLDEVFFLFSVEGQHEILL